METIQLSVGSEFSHDHAGLKESARAKVWGFHYVNFLSFMREYKKKEYKDEKIMQCKNLHSVNDWGMLIQNVIQLFPMGRSKKNL